MSTLIQHAENPVYQFLDKKRSEGKHYYVYMTAGATKFLRIYYGTVNAYLFFKDIGMSACSGQGQNQNITVNAIDQQPIWLDMALSMSYPISGQGMVSVFLLQGLSVSQSGNNILQQLDVQAALYGKLIIPLELRSRLDGVS